MRPARAASGAQANTATSTAPIPPPPAPEPTTHPPKRAGIPWPAIVVLVLILVALGVWRWHETAKTPLPPVVAGPPASGPSGSGGGGDEPILRQIGDLEAGGEVVALAVSPDGHWLAWGLGARGAGVAAFDSQSSQRIINFRSVGFTAQTTSATFLDNQTLLATMGEGLYVCSLRTRVASPLKLYDPEKQGRPLCVAGAASGGGRVRLAVGLSTGAIEMLDALITQGVGLLEGEPRQFDAHKGPVRSILFLNNSRYVASASEDATIRVMYASDGRYVTSQPIAHSEGGPQFGRSMDILSQITGNVLLVTTGREQAVIWDARSWTVSHRLENGSPITAAAFSIDGLLATASSQTLTVWDAQSGARVGHALRPHGGQPIGGLAWTPDGKTLLSGGADGHLRRWSVGK